VSNCTCGTIWNSILPPPPCPAHSCAWPHITHFTCPAHSCAWPHITHFTCPAHYLPAGEVTITTTTVTTSKSESTSTTTFKVGK
jgi:hypothetical protein